MLKSCECQSLRAKSFVTEDFKRPDITWYSSILVLNRQDYPLCGAASSTQSWMNWDFSSGSYLIWLQSHKKKFTLPNTVYDSPAKRSLLPFTAAFPPIDVLFGDAPLLRKEPLKICTLLQQYTSKQVFLSKSQLCYKKHTQATEMAESSSATRNTNLIVS